jgi:hypothetical protein
MSDQTCRCLGVVDSLHHALTGTEPPVCDLHNQAPSGTPIALNDDQALAAKIGAALTKENH